MRALKVKLSQVLIVKVTFDTGAYQGKIVGKAYVKAGVTHAAGPLETGTGGAVAAEKG